TMSKRVIRSILDAMTCLTPSPKKQKKGKTGSDDEEMYLPQNDSLTTNNKFQSAKNSEVRLGDIYTGKT
ncbi:hypothetical protein X777_02562, partial [Ooceraea biroi]